MFKKWHGNPWAILITLSLGFFMTLLDLTIVNIAIPQLGEDLGASLDEILWIVNAYTLALAVLLITGGRLGDLRGKRNLFAAGVTVFTLASLACGLAQDPAQLIGFRAVQGLGAALLMPQTLSIIAEVFPADRRGVAMGIWGAVAGVSGASVRSSAGCSSPICPGAGSSSSTCRSARWCSCSPWRSSRAPGARYGAASTPWA